MILPSSLLQSLQDVPGFNEDSFVAVHRSGEQVVSIRINPFKKFTPLFELNEKVPWSSNGYYLPQRPSFTTDPSFHAGAYYVQEASSMFLEHALKKTCDLSQPLKVLDLCAAPGGKSTLIQSLLNEKSVLVSNEIIRQRSAILEENITKWGAANVIVTNNKPSDFSHLEGLFDVIVIDAPCSGSGLFRKDPQAINEWSLNNVEMCCIRQKQILKDIIPCLKENGVLIYSTCSYSVDEDENILSFIQSMNEFDSMRLHPQKEWNIVEVNENGYGYRFYPDKLKGEGFFIAAFKRTSGNNFQKRIKKHVPFTNKDLLSQWIDLKKELIFIKHKDAVIALPEVVAEMLLALEGLYIKKAGVLAGTIIRNELIPEHALALSTIINQNIPSVHVDLDDALQFLRRAEWSPQNKVQGWTLIKYHSLSLGWIKGIGNRINNYYPKEWRILNK